MITRLSVHTLIMGFILQKFTNDYYTKENEYYTRNTKQYIFKILRNYLTTYNTVHTVSYYITPYETCTVSYMQVHQKRFKSKIILCINNQPTF